MTVNKVLIAAALALAPMAVSAQDWTGAYAGFAIGGSDINAEVKPLENLPLEGDGGSTGIFAGYNYQMGNVVYGVEFDFDATNYRVGEEVLGSEGAVLVESTARLKGRIGAPIGDNGLAYGVVGVVGASTNSVIPEAVPVVGGFAVEDGVGYLFGVGYDMKFGNNLLAGAEVLYHEFDDDNLNVDVTTFRFRVGYTF